MKLALELLSLNALCSLKFLFIKLGLEQGYVSLQLDADAHVLSRDLCQFHRQITVL